VIVSKIYEMRGWKITRSRITRKRERLGAHTGRQRERVLGMVASTAEVGRGSRAGERLHLLQQVLEF
jgi:hypothetical protein